MICFSIWIKLVNVLKLCLLVKILVTDLQWHSRDKNRLTEVDQHLAKALSHVLWHCQDTGDVVVEEGIFLLH